MSILGVSGIGVSALFYSFNLFFVLASGVWSGTASVPRSALASTSGNSFVSASGEGNSDERKKSSQVKGREEIRYNCHTTL